MATPQTFPDAEPAEPASPPAPMKFSTAIAIHEPLPDAIKHILLQQFDRVIAGVTDADDPDTGIHTARKAMKRLRALYRLIRDEVGYSAYRNENVLLRDVARKLAPARDGAVIVETLTNLTSLYDGLLHPDAFSATRSFLDERRRQERSSVLDNHQLLTDVSVTLRTARARINRWDPWSSRSPNLAAAGISNDFSSVAGGLGRVYRRGRQAFRHAYEVRTEEAFHDWRKRVKYLRYQLEALRPIWPEMLDAQCDRLDHLGEALGTDHDLAVLAELVRAHPEAVGTERERTLLLTLIGRRRLELQHDAHPLGISLYGEKTASFTGRIGSYWHAAVPVRPQLRD